MKNELSLKDFDLYQKMIASGVSHIFQENIDLPLINFTKSYITISDSACKLIGITKESNIITASKDDVLYLVNLPFDSKLMGYKQMINTRLRNPMFSINGRMKHKFEIGVYQILEPIFVSRMDFYELEFFKKIS